MTSPLHFQPWEAAVEPAFWGDLGEWKLREAKLNETPVSLIATYAPSNFAHVPEALSINATGLATALQREGAPAPPLPGSAALRCQIFCVNTLERLQTFDRDAAAAAAGAAVWSAAASGAALADPSLLQTAIVVAYCDLKHYKYHFMIGYPTLEPPQPIMLTRRPVTLVEHFGGAEHAQAVSRAIDTQARGMGGVRGFPSLFLLKTGAGDSAAPQCSPLSDLDALRQHEDVYLVFSDPSNATDRPGWALQNALLAVAARPGPSTLRVLCLRTRRGRPDPQASLVLEINLPELPEGFSPAINGGWATAAGAAAPTIRVANLASAMDPTQLAEAAVDLNLQLMRWRAAPALETGPISSTRCLLLGAGTLGCSVARVLLGWGVRHITLVDNSRVSYSNPVRQSLFTFEDCLSGGRPKAAAAAAALRAVFPGTVTEGVELTIPMPGHPPHPTEIEKTRQDAEKLAALVDAHDVVFLLLDTREARWAATLMAAAAGKLAITAALGFESFVVMRHGAGPEVGSSGSDGDASGNVNEEADQTNDDHDTTQPDTKNASKLSEAMRLGCYFCADVTAPANSTRDRTLDQQCTVARPGLSGIAGSLAVEMAAAVLTHPQGISAPPAGFAPSVGGDEAAESPPPVLGEVPHMIRSHLTGFSQTCMTGMAFPQCPACSATVVGEFRRRGADFVLQAVSEAGYLEELTGLSQLQREMEEMALEREREASEAAAAAGEGEGGQDGEEEWEEL